MKKSEDITLDSILPTMTEEEEKEYGSISLESILGPMSEEERIELGEEIFGHQVGKIQPPPSPPAPASKSAQPASTRKIEQAQQACGQALDEMQLGILDDVLSKEEFATFKARSHWRRQKP